MNRAQQSGWDDADHTRLAQLADALLPGCESMPSARGVNLAVTGLNRVFDSRPDLVAPLLAVVRAGRDDAPEAYLARLQESDSGGWQVLTTCVAAGYYMDPAVRRRLGYAGQEGVLITADDFYGWAATGLLDPVLERGPVHRPTPA
jgi:hypothetical protein